MTFAATLAEQRPDEIAVRDSRVTLSWSDADDYLRPIVNAIVSSDLGPARRVAVLASNSVETLLAYAACTLAGASAVAVNSNLTAPETAYILTDSKAGLVLCDAKSALVAAAAAANAGVDKVVMWGDEPAPTGVTPWTMFCVDDSEPATDLEPRPTLVYTSGTTGRPKGVELPATSWVGGSSISEHLELLGRNRLVEYGRHLVVGPLYHSGPLTGTRLFVAGVPVTVLGKFDAEALLTAIGRDRIGSSIMVPTHFQRLLALPEAQRLGFDVSSLRYVLQVGSKCPADVKRAMIDWFGPILWESYGASEVGTTCMISASEWLAKPGSVGRAVPPFTAFIADSNGDPAAPGTEGPLWFTDSTGNGISYITGHRTGDTFTLGEIGRMDTDGYVWITDRLSDMVVSGGVNIYPAEVEQVLVAHPGVADAACFGVPDEAMGERLVAVVVPALPDQPPSSSELNRYARESLAGYKIPKHIDIVAHLPRSAVGKLDKRAIRATTLIGDRSTSGSARMQ